MTGSSDASPGSNCDATPKRVTEGSEVYSGYKAAALEVGRDAVGVGTADERVTALLDVIARAVVLVAREEADEVAGGAMVDGASDVEVGVCAATELVCVLLGGAADVVEDELLSAAGTSSTDAVTSCGREVLLATGAGVVVVGPGAADALSVTDGPEKSTVMSCLRRSEKPSPGR